MDVEDLNRTEKIVYDFIDKSNKFDSDFYLENYGLNEGDNPLVHYIKEGIFNGCKPNKTFDIKFYLKRYPDVKNKVINPFYHYVKYGIDGCRMPYYLSNDEIKKLKLSSKRNIRDYIIFLNSDKFDVEYYCNNYSLDSFDDPIAHFVELGVYKGNNPNNWFDTKYYLDVVKNLDINEINPFFHYLKVGRFDNLLPKKYKLEDFDKMNLKKSIKGKNGFLFLFNDSNNELKQHFDFNYENKFSEDEFLDEYYFKKNLFENNDIEYYYFSVPDKSIVCRDFLPFDVVKIKRNVDSCDEIVDFADYLNNTCYYKVNSHINIKGSEIIAFKILNHIDNNFTIKEWNNIVNTTCEDVEIKRGGDLLLEKNWSFSIKEKRIFYEKYSGNVEYTTRPKNISHEKIPKEFEFCRKRESSYVKNEDSFSDKKVLFFRDSSFQSFIDFFSFYFREIFAYWDHGSLNDDLIKYFNPDIIIELRTERFIDDLFKSEWVINKKDIFSNNVI